MKFLRFYGQLLLTRYEMLKIINFSLFRKKITVFRQTHEMNRLTVDNRRFNLFFPIRTAFYGYIFFIYRTVDNRREIVIKSTVVYDCLRLLNGSFLRFKGEIK